MLRGLRVYQACIDEWRERRRSSIELRIHVSKTLIALYHTSSLSHLMEE